MDNNTSHAQSKNNTHQTKRNNITFHASFSTENTQNTKTLTQNIINLKNKYPTDIWIPIDKNVRQAARACPLRFHQELKHNFINDTKHFEIITTENDNDINTVEEKTMTKILSKLKPTWLKHTWKNKPNKMPSLYLTIKQDGVRVRPIGTYAKAPHKKLLSYASTALITMLRYSGMKQFSLFESSKLKSIIQNFENTAIQNINNPTFNHQLYDIKNFYTEIQQKPLEHRLKFCANFFRKTNKTDYISIPKNKANKANKAHPGADTTSQYISFHINTLIEIAHFAINNAYFILGNHILKQILGLAMGDPMSAPLAFIYVAYDEHACTLHKYIKPNNEICMLFLRYADDIYTLFAYNNKTLKNKPNKIDNISKYIKHHLYEHDIENKNLLIKKEKTNTFLDANIIFYNNHSQVKLTYNNKNTSILRTRTQTIGRFHDVNAYTSTKIKTNACATILTRIADFTTLTQDMLIPTIELITEMLTLGYNINHIHATLMKANRSRPSNNWTQIDKAITIVKQLQSPT